MITWDMIQYGVWSRRHPLTPAALEIEVMIPGAADRTPLSKPAMSNPRSSWVRNGIRAIKYSADSRLTPSQWETSLQSNTASHWLDANLESALKYTPEFSLIDSDWPHQNSSMSLLQRRFDWTAVQVSAWISVPGVHSLPAYSRVAAVPRIWCHTCTASVNQILTDG